VRRTRVEDNMDAMATGSYGGGEMGECDAAFFLQFSLDLPLVYSVRNTGTGIAINQHITAELKVISALPQSR